MLSMELLVFRSISVIFFSSVRILNVCCCLSNGTLVYPLGLTPSPSNPLAPQAFGEMRCNKLGRFLNFAS